LGYYKASKHPKTSQQVTAGMRKYITLMMPQKLDIIWRPERDDS